MRDWRAREPFDTPIGPVKERGSANGQNIINIHWENDLVVVTRWIRGGSALNEFLGKVLAAQVPSSWHLRAPAFPG